MHLETLHFSYRSFKEARLDKLGAINVLIGANNGGKSSILDVLRHLGLEATRTADGLQLGTIPEGSASLEFNGESLAYRPEGRHSTRGCRYTVSTRTTNADETISFPSGSDIVGITQGSTVNLTKEFKNEGYPHIQTQERLSRKLPRIDQFRDELISTLRNTYHLGHARGGAEPSPQGLHGQLDSRAHNLAGRLESLLSSQPITFRERLNEFIQNVLPDLGQVSARRLTDKDDIRVQLTFRDTHLEKDVPLSALGGGVEQVVALATVLLGEPDARILLLEEPESHLHEAAQRRLARQLAENRGERQLFIATHSPVFINAFEEAEVFKVTKSSGISKVEHCISSKTQRDVLDALGVLPSSVLQTNCVIWVEGPTERELVRFWLRASAPLLHEHEHYELVMTGGSLLAHFDADADGDAIAMAKVCRNGFLLCDRDAGAGGNPAKQAVRRLVKEFADRGWVTHDYEIEWYFPEAAVAKVWEGANVGKLFQDSSRSKPFYPELESVGGPSANTSKVAAARRIIEAEPDLAAWFNERHDLEKLVRRMVEVVRQANDLSETEG